MITRIKHWLGNALALARTQNAIHEQTEEALRKSEAHLRGMLANSPDTVYTFDLSNRKIAFLNREIFCGYTRSELESANSILSAIHPDDLSTVKENWKQVITGRTTTPVEYRLRRKDGELEWIEQRISILSSNPDGSPKELMVILSIITERKQMNQILHKGEEKYRTLFDNAGDAIIIHDENGRMLSVNSLACERYGYTREELMSMRIDQVDSPAESQYARERIERLMRQGHHTFETVHQRKDGSLVATDVSARRITWEGIPAMMSICRDMTERKQIETALRDSNAKLETLIRVSPLAVTLLDANGNVRMWNPAAERIFGWSAPEVLGHPNPIVQPSKQSEYVSLSKQIINGNVLSEFETVRQRKDGSLIDVSISSAPVRNVQGQVSGRMAIVADITERKRAEKALRESQARFSTIFHSSPIGIGISRLDGNFSDANDALCELLGYTHDELVNHTSHELNLWVNSAQHDLMIQSIQTKGNAHNLEVQLRCKSCEILDVLVNAEFIELNGERNILASLLDITERKHVEEKVQENEARFRSIYNTEPECVKILNPDCTLVDMNPAGLAMIEAESLDMVKGKSVLGIVEKDFREEFKRLTEDVCQKGRGGELEFKIIGLKGTPRWLETHAVPLRDSAGQITSLLSITRDITERKRAEEELRYLSTHDILTNIFNRTFFETELARIEQSRNFPVSIITGDLDNLKTTNDSLGHAAGDELIKSVAQVLQAVFRASDIIARIGGDEFAVLLPNTDSMTAGQMLARVRAKLTEHNTVHPNLPVELSLGVATSEKNNLAKTFTIADQQMYADKAVRKAKH